MSEEISRILTMVEEGKLDKEKAAELINALQENGNQVNLNKQTSSSYLNKMLKIRVTSEDGDNVNVNLPIKLIKAVLKVGTSIAEKFPESEKYIKDLDVELLIEAIDNELDGQIVDITSANGDKVLVVIE
ncbi:SHOCT-like domain-containing protein [Virgibacillus sp. 6R]|uniref:SHOCT-like domain-containing protein n=1 Tax=Metabacillus sp. 22489 TaxID=3453928 RepID=UPI0011A8223E